ncbi:MAG: DUF2220 family protein [Chromatiales bacterium]|jgi:hypothetical protein
MQDRPPWLDDVPELRVVLERFLDKLDRRPAEQWKQPPAISLEAENFPLLFRMDEISDQAWALFKTLADDGIWSIRLNRRRGPYDAEFLGARIQLQLEAEPILREWLGRPRQVPYAQQWQAAVDRMAARFPGDPAGLRGRPIALPGRSAEDVLEAIAEIGVWVNEGLTLRQLSARCFWGDSKLLDSRQELLQGLYPELFLSPRRLLVNLYLPPRVEAVLFIENLDSYLDALAQRSLTDAAGLILVYSAGFRGSAERVRQRDQVCLHYSGAGSAQRQRQLENWWFGETDSVLPCYFWGDLDFAGIAILKALRQRFTHMQSWQPGYTLMLERLARGHPAEDAGKQEQLDPGETGCRHADERLLPALRRAGRFIDQEAVSWQECLGDGNVAG